MSEKREHGKPGVKASIIRIAASRTEYNAIR
jgi:hypothetical protein